MTILIAEDYRANALVVSGFIKRYSPDIKVEFAVNGQEAVDLFRHRDFQLVLMDINMPLMDGITATKEIKKIHEEVPVVAITAVGIDRFKERNALSMFDQILFKPLNYDLFIKVLDNVFQHAEPHCS